MSLKDFLVKYFSEEKFASFKEAIQRFAGGFDLADPVNASVFSLRNEWSKEEGEQYRVPGGYSQLIDYFVKKCTTNGTHIHYDSIVTNINYSVNNVVVQTSDGQSWHSDKLIVTVSAGVLKSDQILFNPFPENYTKAIHQLGFGTVIKFLLEFKERFWEDVYPGSTFFITNEAVPTWWTESPVQSNLLTGWLGGPAARRWSNITEDELLSNAINSLANSFNITREKLKENLQHYEIVNWQNTPFVCGGYSYATVDSTSARKTLLTPLLDTIFFAGEALWSGQPQGTVEAALQSGNEVADKIIQLSNHR
ncbi:MAG: NAD(P)/FAD-dependent oxidoreductase [Chitinophagaceae bacterium]